MIKSVLKRGLAVGVLSLCAGAGVALANDWVQWHPHAGDRGISAMGTQCYFCPQPAKPAPAPAPVDSDGDGVYDDKDKCPGTPRGVKVDAVGCPLDSDGDGVTDDKDQCPDTPKGATVNAQGCWVLKGVNFDTGKSVIKPQYSSILDGVATILKNNSNVNVEVGGHTDDVGADNANLKLSDSRANAVKNYLIKAGVDAKRLTAKGYGETKPVASNDNDAGRAENRRVELQTSRK
ncbi:MAG: OmpA family protein [Magnetococcales bacterium]|nr:OmpA family protein [Magnetococcales bacterium]NGZ25897.1 OmpA family protein [Magnetococcales bacterium]